jgi:peptidoglycan hydrolase-like protein with peptidoglycan-binding domain
MRKGSRGDRVKTVQKALNDAGFSCGPVDGRFGSMTEQAVRGFQAAHQPEAGPVDGIVGKVTWAVLVD